MIERLSLIFAFVIFAACSAESPESAGPTGEPPEEVSAQTGTSAGADSPLVASLPAGSPPCSYISEADVSDLLGHPMKVNPDGPPGECVLISGSGDPTKSVSFRVMEGSQMYESMAAAAGAEPISGLGDRAVVIPNSHMVSATKGGQEYLGGIYLAGAPETKEKSIELARKVVPRM